MTGPYTDGLRRKNKKNILSMQIFIAFPSVFNIWLNALSKLH